MIFFPFIHFFAFLACVYLAVFIASKNTKSLLNQSCSILMLCYALWNLGDVVLHNPDPGISLATVELMQNMASVGWVSFASVLLCFSLAFSGKGKLLRQPWFLFIVSSLPLLFIYKQLTNTLTINPVRQLYGWSIEWTDTLWTYLFYIYYLSFSLSSVLIIYFYGRHTKNRQEKKQAGIMVVSFSLALVAGTISDIIIQEMGHSRFPPVANLMVFVFASGVIYAIYKFRFLTISPGIAAENILAAMDEILILLNREGTILTVNKAAVETLHYRHKELEGQAVSLLFQDNKFNSFLLEQIRNEESLSNLEGYFSTKNGKQVPMIYSSSPLKDNSGTVIGTVFLARNLTEQKRIENELLASKEKAEESDRLKSAFLANMSHEIRTPMNGILGFAELLKEPDLTGEQQQEYVSVIEKSGVRMLNIINDIVDISRIESGAVKIDLKASDINEQIDFIAAFFKPEAEAKGLQLFYKNSLDSTRAVIQTDREKVFAILTNLVKNAIKYTNHGSIELGYGVVEARHAETGNALSSLQFYVKDTGIGIPKARQEAIFERFIQADLANRNAYQGAGLGLAIAKSYVEMLGGKIWLKSEEGKGSAFYFSLPYTT